MGNRCALRDRVEELRHLNNAKRCVAHSVIKNIECTSRQTFAMELSINPRPNDSTFLPVPARLEARHPEAR